MHGGGWNPGCCGPGIGPERGRAHRRSFHGPGHRAFPVGSCGRLERARHDDWPPDTVAGFPSPSGGKAAGHPSWEPILRAVVLLRRQQGG
eukprot:6475473-Heterocapsa_arctica.AAC.1